MNGKIFITVLFLFISANFFAQIPPNDVGIITILSPQSGSGLGVETVSVIIKNYGTSIQTNFNIAYELDAGTPVVQNFPGPISPTEEITVDFTVPVDISNYQTYFILAKTILVGDQDPTNDAIGMVVTNDCTPGATSGCGVDGIKRFVLNTINVDNGGDGCNTEPPSGPDGYADRTHLSTVLSNVAGSNEYVLQAQQNWTGGAGVERLSVWVDFNDDGQFEVSERLISGEFFQDFAVLEDFQLTIPVGASTGLHILRAKAIDGSAAGNILEPCTGYAWGETQDYTVVVTNVLGINDVGANSELIIRYLPNNHFVISSNATSPNLELAVYSLSGKLVKKVSSTATAGTAEFRFQMAHQVTGMYLVVIQNHESNVTSTGKIIVQ